VEQFPKQLTISNGIIYWSEMSPSYRPVLIIAISIVAIAIGIPRAAHADASSPSSTLAIGDWWKYDFQIRIDGLTLTGPITETLASQQSISIHYVDYNSYRITLSGSGSVTGSILGYSVSGSWTASGEDYTRTTDLADIKSHISFQISIQIAAPVPNNSFTTTLISDTTNNPPSQTLQFPLSVGAHWATTVTSTTSTTTYSTPNPTPVTNVTTTTDSQNSDVTSYSVTAVPAGSFDTYLVRTTSSSGSTNNYYSPEVENMIKIQDYNSTGGLTASFNLSAYSAWPYKSAIALSMNGNQYTAVVGTDISAYNVHQDTLSIIFQVTGTDGITGRASIWLPIKANDTDIKVLVDANPATFTISQNQTYYQILFTYPLSTHTITVTYATVMLLSPFLQQYLLPLILAIAAVAAVIIIVTILLVVRRKSSPQPQPAPYQQPPTTPPSPAESPPVTPPPSSPP
jgi:hypothetical protein